MRASDYFESKLQTVFTQNVKQTIDSKGMVKSNKRIADSVSRLFQVEVSKQEERSKNLMLLTAHERYLAFCSDYPHLSEFSVTVRIFKQDLTELKAAENMVCKSAHCVPAQRKQIFCP